MSSDLKSLSLSAQVPTTQEVTDAISAAVEPLMDAIQDSSISPDNATFNVAVTSPEVLTRNICAVNVHTNDLEADHCVTAPTVLTERLSGTGGVYSLDNDPTSGVVRFKDLPTGSGETDTSGVSYRLSEHIRCVSNPHEVNAAQVGAYTKAETDQRITALASRPSSLATCCMYACSIDTCNVHTCKVCACVVDTICAYATTVFSNSIDTSYANICGLRVTGCLQIDSQIYKESPSPFYFHNKCGSGYRTIQIDPDDKEIRFDDGSTALKSTDIGNTVARHFTTGSGLVMNSNRVLSVTASGGGVPSGAELEPVLRGESGCVWAVALGHGACAPTLASPSSTEEFAKCYYGPVALGPGSSAKEHGGALAVGACSHARGLATAVGANAAANGCGAVALGDHTGAYGNLSFAIGPESTVGCSTCLNASRFVGVIGARAQGHGNGTLTLSPLYLGYEGGDSGICFGMVLDSDVDSRQGGITFYNKFYSDDIDCFTVSYSQLKNVLSRPFTQEGNTIDLHPYGGSDVCFGMVLYAASGSGYDGGIKFYEQDCSGNIDCFCVDYPQLKSVLTGSGVNTVTCITGIYGQELSTSCLRSDGNGNWYFALSTYDPDTNAHVDYLLPWNGCAGICREQYLGAGGGSSTGVTICNTTNFISIGETSLPNGRPCDSNIRIGFSAYPGMYDTVTIGSGISTEGSSQAIAIGSRMACRVGSHSVAIGHVMSADAPCSVVIGHVMSADAPCSVVIGISACSCGSNAIVIGSDVATYGFDSSRSVVIGHSSSTVGDCDTIVMGTGSRSGCNCTGTGGRSTVIGHYTAVDGDNATAIGNFYRHPTPGNSCEYGTLTLFASHPPPLDVCGPCAVGVTSHGLSLTLNACSNGLEFRTVSYCDTTKSMIVDKSVTVSLDAIEQVFSGASTASVDADVLALEERVSTLESQISTLSATVNSL